VLPGECTAVGSVLEKGPDNSLVDLRGARQGYEPPCLCVRPGQMGDRDCPGIAP
jgi:hypothetical protein